MGQLARIEKRSLESPSVSLLNPSAWLLEAFGVRSTDAGVRVSEFTAQRVSVWWACRKVISETIACVPLITYQQLPRGRQHAKNFPIYDLLHDTPNPEMTSFQWREMTAAHVVDWGNGYSEIERDGGGVPIALWPLLPDRTRVERRRVVDEAGRPLLDMNGMPVMKRVVATWVPGVNGVPEEKILPAENVLHIAGLGYDGLRGYSPVQMARQGLGLALAAEEFGARWFGSGSRPSGVLEYPQKLKPQDRDALRTGFEAVHQGLGQSHRIAILEQGMTFKAVSVNPNDAQFIETRQAQVPEICRWHRMPPHMVQDLSRGTFSNIEIQSIEFVRFTMLGWFVRIEQHLQRALLTPKQQGKYSIQFLVEGLLRGALKERYDAYAVGRQWGWLCADDIRELENMNALPNNLGQQFLVPMNMIPADQAANVGQKPEAPGSTPAAPSGGGDGTGDGADPEADPGTTDPGTDGSPAMKARKARLTILAAGEQVPAGLRNVTPETAAPSAAAQAERELRDRLAALTAGHTERANDLIKQRQQHSAELRNKHRKAFLPVFKAAGEEIVNQLVKATKTNLDKARGRSQREDEPGGPLSLHTFNSEMERFAGGFSGTVKRTMKPVVASFGATVQDAIGDELGQDIDDSGLHQMADSFAAAFATRFIDSAMGQLRGILNKNVNSSDDDTAAAISDRLNEWQQTWPNKIANRESVRANGAISSGTYQGAGVTEITWVCGSRPCDLCAPYDGKTIAAAGNFASAGEVVDPGEDSDTAPMTVSEDVPYPPLHGDGCECSISAG